DGFARDQKPPEDRKLDKATITSRTLLAGGEEARLEGGLTGPKRKARFLSRATKDGGKWKVDSFLVVDGQEAPATAARAAGDAESAQAIAGEFLELAVAARWNQARGVCSRDYLKKLMGVFTENLWAEEALAQLFFFPDHKPGDGFASDTPIPED